MEPIATFALVLALCIALFASVVVIPMSRGRRAVAQVIGTFREHHSSCSEDPKSLEELGLQLRSAGVLDFQPRLRDYKPYALKALIQAEVVRVRGDGRMCLAEERLRDLALDARER